MRLSTPLLAGFLLLAGATTTLGQDLSGQVAEANRLFQEGKFDQARQRYLEALKKRPDLPQLHFNLGDALYKSKDFEKALESFRESLEKSNPDMQANAWYNLGNALFHQGQLQKSLDAYKESLKLNPSDPDAKHNLEYVLKKIQQQPPQQQQKQGQDDQKQQDQKQEKKQQSNPSQSSQDKKQQSQQQEQQQDQQQQPQEENQEQSQKQESADQPQPSPSQKSPSQGEKKSSQQEAQAADQQRADGKMSPEEVRRLLDALKEDPEQFLKRKFLKPSKVKVKKDW